MVSKITEAARGITQTLSLLRLGGRTRGPLDDEAVKALIAYSDLHVQVRECIIKLAQHSRELLEVFSSLVNCVALHNPGHNVDVLKRFQETTVQNINGLAQSTSRLLAEAEVSVDGILQNLKQLADQYKEADALSAKETQSAKRLKQLRQKRIQFSTTQATILRIAEEEQSEKRASEQRKELEARIAREAAKQLDRRLNEISTLVLLIITALAHYFNDGHQVFRDAELQWRTLQTWNAQTPITYVPTATRLPQSTLNVLGQSSVSLVKSHALDKIASLSTALTNAARSELKGRNTVVKPPQFPTLETQGALRSPTPLGDEDASKPMLNKRNTFFVPIFPGEETLFDEQKLPSSSKVATSVSCSVAPSAETSTIVLSDNPLLHSGSAHTKKLDGLTTQCRPNCDKPRKQCKRPPLTNEGYHAKNLTFLGCDEKATPRNKTKEETYQCAKERQHHNQKPKQESPAFVNVPRQAPTTLGQNDQQASSADERGRFWDTFYPS